MTLVATFGPPDYDQSPLLLALVAVAVVLVVVYALATLPTDPRIAIAGAVPFSTITLGTPSAGLLALVAPVVLAIAVVRLRHLGARRRSDRSSVRRCPQRPAVRRGWQRAARRIASGPCSRTRPS